MGELLRTAREEATEFVSTRIRLASAELSEKKATLKVVAPMTVIGALLAVTAWPLLSAAAAAALASRMGNSREAWAAGLAVVGVLEFLVGAGCLLYVASVLRANSLVPERTLRVLKQDRSWIQNEARIES